MLGCSIRHVSFGICDCRSMFFVFSFYHFSMHHFIGFCDEKTRKEIARLETLQLDLLEQGNVVKPHNHCQFVMLIINRCCCRLQTRTRPHWCLSTRNSKSSIQTRWNRVQPPCFTVRRRRARSLFVIDCARHRSWLWRGDATESDQRHVGWLAYACRLGTRVVLQTNTVVVGRGTQQIHFCYCCCHPLFIFFVGIVARHDVLPRVLCSPQIILIWR